MDDLKVGNVPLHVIPVTEYDPFEAKFAASLYWLVFRATEDGEFDNIPSQVTSPIQRDSEKRITVRSEVTEFLTNGEIYCKVCDRIFHGKVPVVGQWAIIQTLSRHGFYVVEEGDIAVTDSALQQRKPFRKSTHLALMDCLMSAFSSQAVSVPQVVQSVSKFSSFDASKELPFDLEDALLLWINKICSALNENQLKKQRQHAEQLLQNQDKAKRFRFRRDQLQPKVQTEFPVMEDLLKDISDGQSLLAIILFYHPTVISLEDIRFGTNLSTEDCVHNLDLFRTLCSQFICTSVLALKLEDLLYGSQAMKPNVIALLAEIFNKCEVESLSTENGIKERPTTKSDVDLRYIVANKENVMDNSSSSAPVMNSEQNRGVEKGSPRETIKGKNEQFSSMSGQLKSSSSDRIEQLKSGVWKSQSDTQVNTNSRLSFKSPFQLDFTVDDDVQKPPLNGPLSKQDVHVKDKEKENPFSGIFQRPVLVGERKGSLPNTGSGGSPRVTPRQEHPLLLRRNKQKQRTLDLEEWDMQQEEVEDKSILQRYLQELHLNDLQRSQSLTGLDKAKVEPRQSFHAWREDTGASLSDTNLTSSRNEKISLDFRPNVSTSAPQRGTQGSIPQRGAEGINVPMKSSGSKAKREEHSSQESLSSTDSLNIRDKPRNSVMSGVRDSCASDISVKELSQFEEIEAKILAGKSVETPRTFVKPKTKRSKAPLPQEDEDDLNTSVSSEDMNMFRLEVLQRLTEDKLQQIPDGAEMEDDDDPIFLARNNAASGSRNPPDRRTRLEVPDAPADDPTDQLSPITETSEPVMSNPNSVSSANSTAPSSPCSPLDVAPFMPAFFTTSPANTLERKSQRFSIKNREDTEETLIGEEEDDFPSDPGTSVTPRFQEKSRERNGLFPAKSKSFEQLARGSYTVGHVSVESAKAAGIPVIGAGRPVSEAEVDVQATGYPVEESLPIHGRTDSSTSASPYQESSEVFHSRKLSQKETDSSRNLSGFRPLALSSGGVELIDCGTERVDGRRDSLETSPALSPALTRGKQDDARQEAALRTRETPAQDSPSDVVIFERSLSNPPEGNTPRDAHSSQMRENVHYNSETVTRSSKSEANVFDFNQDTVQHYKNGHTAQDFRTYKKSKQGGLAKSEVPQVDRRAASFNEDSADQRSQRSQQDAHFGTYYKKPYSKEQEQSTAGQQQTSGSLDGRPRHRTSEEARAQGVSMKDLRQSDGFSTFRKDSTSEMNSREVEPSAHALDLRRSDGFTTFRKGAPDAASENMSAQLSTVSTRDQRKIETDRFSTFAKSAKKQSDAQNYAQDGLRHFQGTNTSERTDLQQATMVARTSSSGGGEGERQSTPRGREEEQIHVSGSSNITRSRTFRKTPDGQIIDDRSFRRSISSGNERDRSPTSSDSKLSGQQTVVTNIRVSPEGAGSDNPHRISWTDESEAGARLTRQLNANVDRSTTQERSPTSSPRRQRSPRHTGRGSPGARISWLTAAKSGVGGQVILNDKGEIEELEQDEAEDEQALTSQLAYLRMQLDEKRRHIEAEKHRAQSEWEDQRRRLGQTAFWYVMGKAQGSQTVGEGPGSEVLHSDKGPVMKPQSHEQPRKPVAEFPDQPSPPIAWSSPANSPLPASASHPHPRSNGQQFETREFRLSDYPPRNELGTNQYMTRPSSQPAVEVSSIPTPIPPRPSSHDPAAHHMAPARRCWNVDVRQTVTPPPLARLDTASINMDTKQETVSPGGGGTAEIEVENQTPLKKGLAMFIGDDANPASQGLTPEQEKKRERFMRLRQKKQEEDRTRKEAELEKKRRREEKQREKEMLQKMEEERLRQEELERQRAEQELRIREGQAAQVPDSFATYRRSGPRQQVYNINDDANSNHEPGHTQLSGFAEFSGPQCYVKPSGKSNRKIIVNAISHVCLSGTVNQDQKEKCLQAISEHDGHHFMILFKDGLKFRGIYVHNLDNDQLFKVFGIGPRVVTIKMIEFLYKYNSGGKEFIKIPSKTISISVDGFAIQKSCWNTGKPVVSSKTASNLKRPPRPPQR